MSGFEGRRAPRALAALAGLLVGLLAAPARAGLPQLAVLPVKPLEGASGRAAERLTVLLREGLLSPEAGFRAPPPPPAPRVEGKPGMAGAAGLFALGRSELAALRFAQAAGAFAQGIQRALADPASADFDAVREAYVQLAVARFRLRQEPEARATLAELARLAPTYQLAAGRFPPVFVSAFETARAAGAKQPRGMLALEGPPGWAVFVDGEAAGPLPARVPALRLGTHSVRAEGPRGERAGLAVTLAGPGTRARLVASVSVPEPPEVLDADFAARLDAYCRAANADFALVAVLAPAGGGAFTLGTALYSVEARGLRVFPRTRLDADLSNGRVEVSGLAELASAAVARFGLPDALPLDLTGLPKPPAAVAQAPELVPPEVVAPKPGTLASKPGTLAPDAAPLAPGAVLSPGLSPLAPGASPQALTPSAVERGPALWAGVPWWVWAAGGAGVAAIAGGTAYGIAQANRRATGTVTATW